jgi:hypothetical protein
MNSPQITRAIGIRFSCSSFQREFKGYQEEIRRVEGFGIQSKKCGREIEEGQDAREAGRYTGARR